MSGELLVQAFHAARYIEIRPVLEQLLAGRRLDEQARTILQRVLVAPRRPREQGPNVEIERILAHPGIDLRHLLTPRDLSAAMDEVVMKECFEAGGHWESRKAGPSWVLIAGSLRDLFAQPWFEDCFFDATNDHEVISFPPDAETVFRLLEAEALPTLGQNVSRYLNALPADDVLRAEVQGLATVVSAAMDRPGWTLAYMTPL